MIIIHTGSGMKFSTHEVYNFGGKLKFVNEDTREKITLPIHRVDKFTHTIPPKGSPKVDGNNS